MLPACLLTIAQPMRVGGSGAAAAADRDARVSLSPLSPTQQLTMSFSMRICLMMSLPFSAACSPSPD